MAAANFRLEMKVTSAQELKNVNWRERGKLRPYLIASVEGESMQSTGVAADGGGGSYSWGNQTIFLTFNNHSDGAIARIHCLHQSDDEDDPETKTSIGRGEIDLHLLAERFSTIGKWVDDLPPFDLKRSSGRPQGKIYAKLRMCKIKEVEDLKDEECFDEMM